MKICPTCSQTYNDETLNFCLSDGAVLKNLSADPNSEATVFMGQPPPTNPTAYQPNFSNPTVVQQNSGSIAQPKPPTYFQPASPTNQPVIQTPKKKSKAWLWVLGILGVLIIFGGIGFIGLIALLANMDDTENANNNANTSPTPTVAFNSILKDDFSKWQTSSNNLGNTEYTNGEFIMSSRQPGYYYVLLTASKNFKTTGASSRVTVRNVTGKEARSGYGLVIHSDIKPLTKDFAFLIDATKQSYRVVQHIPNSEIELVSWTRFPAIRSGTQTNELEIKDNNGKMSFFINNQFAVTVNDTVNYKDGIYGLYVSDAVPVAFSNLQIAK